ncbi:MAG: cyclase family protein [Pseudomonadales bacterium]
MKLRVTLFALCLTGAVSALAVEPPAPMSRAEFDRTMQEISNWGRWGKDDELGTLNLITPKVRKKAARLVKRGTSVSLALELNKRKNDLNPNPFEHQLQTQEFGGHVVAGDQYAVQYHGFAHSHMDGLPHFAHKGFMYNGVPFDSLQATGAPRLGIENAGVAGVFTRGVLVDVPWLLGKPYMEPGTAITAADLEAWERKTGVTVGPGDVLLVRTGRWVKAQADPDWFFIDKAAGAHASLATWLKARDVAMIGSDGVSDVMPSGVEGLANPLHALLLVGLGMPILDNLDLEALAEKVAQQKRQTFLFVAAPLRVPGGTGSPLNPLAVF